MTFVATTSRVPARDAAAGCSCRVRDSGGGKDLFWRDSLAYFLYCVIIIVIDVVILDDTLWRRHSLAGQKQQKRREGFVLEDIVTSE